MSPRQSLPTDRKAEADQAGRDSVRLPDETKSSLLAETSEVAAPNYSKCLSGKFKARLCEYC
jgi:hypothetical protein